MKNLETTISNLLSEMKRHFENGKYTHTTCKEDTPLYELIRDLHDGALPKDFVFSKVYDLLVCLGDSASEESTIEDLRDEVGEAADQCVDIYNNDLIEWSRNSYEYIDEYIEEIGPSGDFISLIRGGQCLQLDRMAHQLIDLINETSQGGE